MRQAARRSVSAGGHTGGHTGATRTTERHSSRYRAMATRGEAAQPQMELRSLPWRKKTKTRPSMAAETSDYMSFASIEGMDVSACHTPARRRCARCPGRL